MSAPLAEIFAVLCWAAQWCPALWPMDCSAPGSSVHWDSLGKSTGAGCHALFQGICPTQDWTQLSLIAGGFFTIWDNREALIHPITDSMSGPVLGFKDSVITDSFLTSQCLNSTGDRHLSSTQISKRPTLWSELWGKS